MSARVAQQCPTLALCLTGGCLMPRPLFIADLAVTSPDLPVEGRFPDRFTAYHEDLMPEVVVTGIPEGTVELALICHDPDAPRPFGFTHWAVYGIPPVERVAVGPGTISQYRVGPNGRGEERWMGPRPPAGHGLHRYYFWAYALSRPVEGAPPRETFLREYGEDIIEQNRMVVTYDRAQES
jgi:Raf kinase inhibitor-like YbhB/YbcL family protein